MCRNRNIKWYLFQSTLKCTPAHPSNRWSEGLDVVYKTRRSKQSIIPSRNNQIPSLKSQQFIQFEVSPATFLEHIHQRDLWQKIRVFKIFSLLLHSLQSDHCHVSYTEYKFWVNMSSHPLNLVREECILSIRLQKSLSVCIISHSEYVSSKSICSIRLTLLCLRLVFVHAYAAMCSCVTTDRCACDAYHTVHPHAWISVRQRRTAGSRNFSYYGMNVCLSPHLSVYAWR